MHARKLIEVAAIVSFHSDTLLEVCPDLNDDAIAEYWVASRCRLDHWGRVLRSLADSTTIPETGATRSLLALAEEITLAGVMTRLLGAFTFAHDLQHQKNETASVARNLHEGHREAATRLRRLMQAWWSSNSPRTRHVRSLSRQAEQWNDLLLAYMGPSVNVERWAYDVSRVREFAYDARQHTGRSSNGTWQLLALSIRTNFSEATRPPCNGELNHRIAGAAIGLFGHEMFDSLGLLKSPWMLRAERTTEESLGKLSKLFTPDFQQHAMELPARWRCLRPE